MLEKIFKFLLQDTSYHIFCISQSYIQETGQDTLDWWRGRSSSTEGGEAYGRFPDGIEFIPEIHCTQ